MVPRLIRDTRPAGSAAGDSVIDMREDESALILIKHCNDMKQQEARLRLITLLLLLVNMALLLFTNRLSPWHQGNFASAGRGVSSKNRSPVLLVSFGKQNSAVCIITDQQPLYDHGTIKTASTACLTHSQMFRLLNTLRCIQTQWLQLLD